MSDYKEKIIEGGIKNIESQTEVIERKLQEIESAIASLEASISRLASKGDREIAIGLEKSLAEKRQEKAQAQEQARNIDNQLDQVGTEIRTVDKWNNEARQETAKLRQTGINVEETSERIANRETFTETSWEKYNELKRRLNTLAKGAGFG
jgi:peptidoglycan hydrolase CwlO-like protein